METMTQKETVEAIEVLAAGAERRTTEYFRWGLGRFYLEVSVDAAGGMSYSTNLPRHAIGKGLHWHQADDRYIQDLAATLDAMTAIVKEQEELEALARQRALDRAQAEREAAEAELEPKV